MSKQTICECGHDQTRHSTVCLEQVCKCAVFEPATENSWRIVTWRHEETGMKCSQYVHSLDPIPELPRRDVIRISKI